MRQGQQNRRGRGRSSNNNRGKGHHNPLSRSFESNGPAERIRGTPAHIAEKYLSLARDAQSSGDTVLEQNYLQHAEHYNRIIMAYRDQFNQPHEGMNGGGQRTRGPGEIGEGFDDAGDDDMAGDDGFPQPFAQAPQGHQAQPRPQEARQTGGEHGRPDRGEPRSERPERSEPRSEQRSDRPERQDRPFRRDRGDRPPRFGDRGDRGERQGFIDRDRQAEPRAESRAEPREPRAEAPERPPEQVADAPSEPRRQRDRFQQPHEQPEFLRRPVRRARSSSSSDNSESGSKSEPTSE